MARTEKDFLGEKQIPDDAYYGVQTQRGKENFHITGMPISREPNIVKAFGHVKKAPAMANRDLGRRGAEDVDPARRGGGGQRHLRPRVAGGSLIAAIDFDLSGTTKIGKYVLNHSFMIPGLVATAIAVFTGLVLAKLMF